MTETEFNKKVEQAFIAVSAAIDNVDSDLDWTLQQGVMEIESAGGYKIILSRHGPNQEIWVAAKSGGFHFQWRDGQWRDTRSGEDLAALLTRVVRELAGIEIPFEHL